MQLPGPQPGLSERFGNSGRSSLLSRASLVTPRARGSTVSSRPRRSTESAQVELNLRRSTSAGV